MSNSSRCYPCALRRVNRGICQMADSSETMREEIAYTLLQDHSPNTAAQLLSRIAQFAENQHASYVSCFEKASRCRGG